MSVSTNSPVKYMPRIHSSNEAFNSTHSNSPVTNERYVQSAFDRSGDNFSSMSTPVQAPRPLPMRGTTGTAISVPETDILDSSCSDEDDAVRAYGKEDYDENDLELNRKLFILSYPRIKRLSFQCLTRLMLKSVEYHNEFS